MADFVEFRITGTETFMIDLRAWRDRVRDDVDQASRGAAEWMASAYLADVPMRTGNLRAHTKVISAASSGPDAVAYQVLSKARHSHLYEFGTKPRRTSAGWFRGVMPAARGFVPAAVLSRSRLVAKIRALLERPVPELGTGVPTVEG